MRSQKEIDELFQQAQQATIEGEKARVKVLWPRLRNAIGESSDLNLEQRRKLSQLIMNYLDQLGLSSEQKVISLDELMKRERPPDPDMWIPY